jgi:hypothetical protein
VEEETSAHILCECEALASFRHMNLGSFFLEPEISRALTWELSGALVKQQGSHDLTWGTKGHQDLGASGPAGLVPTCNLI